MRASRTLVIAVALTVVVGTLPVAVATLAPGSASAISLGDTVSGAPDDAISVAPGETVTVRVWANTTAVRGYQTNVTFDPTIAEIDSVAGSDDFDSPVTNVNNEAGWVAFNQLRSEETDDPVLAEITLTVPADATGTTQLAFVEADTKLSNSDGETVAPEAFNSIELRVDNGSATPTDTATPSETDTATATEAVTDTDGGEDGNGTDGSDSSNDGGSSDSDDDDDNDSGGGGGAVSPPEPSFSVINTSLNRTSVAPEQSVMVSGTIENAGDRDGTFEARIYDNGTVTGRNASVEVPDGEQRQVNLTVRFNTSGVHAVKLNTTSVGNVTVRAANSTTNGTTNSAGNETMTETAARTVSSTPGSTASATVTDTETATASQTAAQTTASDTGTSTTTPVSDTQTATTDGSGPGFSLTAVVVSLSLLLGWLGHRRDGKQ
ncbi:cohesin domain-containing protein [Haloarcula sp. NS06]|uniref:cohesin domain-containing protein n=1 Tax=unclassified Haloarcula TaxID=2624677 RepID=UPI0027B3AEBA|nr:cohesin domain-containing protein [Haloarcula sp. H-GB4]MDQ2073582.1 cohesin domain-containing protein [Haloarcula sp. H-GB4]